MHADCYSFIKLCSVANCDKLMSVDHSSMIIFHLALFEVC